MKGGQLKILNEDQIHQIHQQALKILAEIGMRVREPQALEILKKAGARADGNIVKLPAKLVKEAVDQAPAKFTLYGRDTDVQAVMGELNVYYEPMIGRLNILDLQTGQRRRTSIDDVANLVKLADALDNYLVLHSGAIMPRIEGVPDGLAHIRGYIASVKNSSKIIKGSCRGKKVARDCLRMASIVAGGEEKASQKPNLFTSVNVISPLEFSVEQTEGLIEYAKRGMPVDIASEPQVGATSPVTFAGTLAQQTAEILCGIVISQLVNPGTPVLMGTVGAAMDMRNGMIALGGVEAAILNVAHAQMAQFYDIPSRGTGCNTESKCLDIQAGFEKAITLLAPALAGANMIFYPGTMEHALTISLESLLIDNEICGMAYHMLRGVDTSETHMAYDLIAEVGQGNHYLNKKHTMENLTTEHYIPKIADRQSWDVWVEQGEKQLWEVARDEVEKILDRHQPLPLSPECEKELAEYEKYVEKRELG